MSAATALPVKRIVNQLITAITIEKSPQAPSTRRCGIARISRKKTVSRERSRSSRTMIRTCRWPSTDFIRS